MSEQLLAWTHNNHIIESMPENILNIIFLLELIMT